ncbi:MAG: hypothetical protein ACE5DW_05205, partial [Thermodesulfobacteriota bacterium]
TWEVIGSETTFLLANAHIYFGDKSNKSPEFKNRIAEVFYLAEWAKSSKKTKPPRPPKKLTKTT